MVVKQYDVYSVPLDPTLGHEVNKTRPCVVVSPDVMNRYLQTVMIAPMTTKSHPYPTRVAVHFKGKAGFVVLDQLRTIDRMRLGKHLGSISPPNVIAQIKAILKEMLVD
jgi:mRNA interferase MazF